MQKLASTSQNGTITPISRILDRVSLNDQVKVDVIELKDNGEKPKFRTDKLTKLNKEQRKFLGEIFRIIKNVLPNETAENLMLKNRGGNEMKVSITNFKSIGKLVDYQLKPLTILSGTNSSGKSSFIQMLLLIKETVDIDSSRIPLYTQGQLFKVKAVKDLIKGKDEKTDISFGLTFKKNDFDRFRAEIPLTIYDGLADYTCAVQVVYGFNAGNSFVKSFSLQYRSAELNNEVIFEQNNVSGEKASITSDNNYLIQRFYDEYPEKINKFQFSGFFPSAVEFTRYVPSSVMK